MNILCVKCNVILNDHNKVSERNSFKECEKNIFKTYKYHCVKL